MDRDIFSTIFSFSKNYLNLRLTCKEFLSICYETKDDYLGLLGAKEGKIRKFSGLSEKFRDYVINIHGPLCILISLDSELFEERLQEKHLIPPPKSDIPMFESKTHVWEKENFWEIMGFIILFSAFESFKTYWKKQDNFGKNYMFESLIDNNKWQILESFLNSELSKEDTVIIHRSFMYKRVSYLHDEIQKIARRTFLRCVMDSNLDILDAFMYKDYQFLRYMLNNNQQALFLIFDSKVFSDNLIKEALIFVLAEMPLLKIPEEIISSCTRFFGAVKFEMEMLVEIDQWLKLNKLPSTLGNIQEYVKNNPEKFNCYCWV